ncbi:WD repeat and HMG-box DNA binding-domain containing protein 1 [Irineochytrium annulatum]|nr:WD repeat and HMG-box DNA binding-domain containing protein 1 [Irineochytrium annulatum]
MLFDGDDGQLDFENRGDGRISFSYQRDLLAVPSSNKAIALIDVTLRSKTHTLSGHPMDVSSVAWSPDGAHLASVAGHHLWVWSSKNKYQKPVFKLTHEAKILSISWHPQSADVLLTDVASGIRVVHARKVVKEDDLDAMFDIPEAKLPEKDKEVMREAEMDEDFVIDDDGAGYNEPLENANQMQRYYDRQIKSTTAIKSVPTSSSESRTVDKAQGVVHPGSTPLKHNRAYLAFDLVGVIYTVQKGLFADVHLEHHDKSRKDSHFEDYNNITMACLNEHGALFASEPDNAIAGGRIEYRSSEGWAAVKGWTVQTGLLESVKAIALTSYGAVAATDQRYLRFITNGGVQIDIRSLDGPVVSMVGCSKLLLVVFHAGAGLCGEQDLGYMLMDAETRCTLRKDRLPLSPGSQLDWIGFSDKECALAYDSVGVLRMLMRHCDFNWVPVFDSRTAKEGKQILHWPVGVAANNLLCVVCKAGDRHPIPPKATISEVKLKLPLINLEADTSAKEEDRLFMHEIPSPTSMDIGEVDKLALALIINSCKNDNSDRAIDLARTLKLIPSIDGALKAAFAFKKSSLIEKLNELKGVRLQKEAEKARASTFIERRTESLDMDLDTQSRTIVPLQVKGVPAARTTREHGINEASGRFKRERDLSALDNSASIKRPRNTTEDIAAAAEDSTFGSVTEGPEGVDGFDAPDLELDESRDVGREESPPIDHKRVEKQEPESTKPQPKKSKMPFKVNAADVGALLFAKDKRAKRPSISREPDAVPTEDAPGKPNAKKEKSTKKAKVAEDDDAAEETPTVTLKSYFSAKPRPKDDRGKKVTNPVEAGTVAEDNTLVKFLGLPEQKSGDDEEIVIPHNPHAPAPRPSLDKENEDDAEHRRSWQEKGKTAVRPPNAKVDPSPISPETRPKAADRLLQFKYSKAS